MKTTRRSGSLKETGFSRTAFTTEKIAVFAPMPSVSAASAARVNAGLCANMRRDLLRSCPNDSMCLLDGGDAGFVVRRTAEPDPRDVVDERRLCSERPEALVDLAAMIGGVAGDLEHGLGERRRGKPETKALLEVP